MIPHILSRLVFLSLILTSMSLNAQQADRIPLWTWIEGERYPRTELPSTEPIYGTKGVPSPANFPGRLRGAVAWYTPDENIWLFNEINLWRYDTRSDMWTWMSGDSTRTNGRYTERGELAPDNHPGERKYAAGWSDAEGNLWLFGGRGKGRRNDIDVGALNDLWKFDVARREWAFMAGTDGLNSSPIYDPAAFPPIPGSRYHASFGTTPEGMFWLFGGSFEENETYPHSIDQYKRRSDLWLFDPVTLQWSRLYGADSMNAPGQYGGGGSAPGSRAGAMGWWDAGGTFWLFGGHGRATGPYFGSLNDLWSFDPTARSWRWVEGDSVTYAPGTFGEKGVASAAGVPSSRYSGVLWGTPDNTLWLFGGGNHDRQRNDLLNYDLMYNDVWRYSPASGEWTWIRGDTVFPAFGTYTRRGLSVARNEAAGRAQAAFAIEPNGSLRLLGGSSYNTKLNFDETSTVFNQDRYDPITDRWTWVEGSILNDGYVPQPPEGENGFPTWTREAITWIDSGGDFRLYNPVVREMWIYSPQQRRWTPLFISSDTSKSTMIQSGNVTPVDFVGYAHYDALGVPSPGNIPGVRYGAAAWNDTLGNLWMYGGYGKAGRFFDGLSPLGRLNDLWKYDARLNQWAWMGGDTTVNKSSRSGPGARYYPLSWAAPDGDLMFYGGVSEEGGSTSFHMDLWRFDLETQTWTLLRPEISSTQERFGFLERALAARYVDREGRILIFGGFGGARFGGVSTRDDLWRYDPALDTWTYLAGDSAGNRTLPYYGERGVPSDSTTPGDRYGGVLWTDESGMIYLFGGYSTVTLDKLSLNDLWRFDPESGQWTWLSGDSAAHTPKRIAAQGVAHPETMFPGSVYSFYNATALAHWLDEEGTLWVFEGVDLWTLGLFDLSKSLPADAGPDITICEGDSVTIGTTATPGLHYTWSDGAGTSSSVTVAPRTTHSYHLGVFDPSNRGYALDSVTVTVTPRSRALIGYAQQGAEVRFTSIDATATSVDWDFGDGSTSTDRTFAHRYTAHGTYTVRLIATGACGTDTAYRTVTIAATSDAPSLTRDDVDFRVWPVPAHDIIELEYALTNRERVTVTLVDMQGRTIALLLDEVMDPGTHHTPLPIESLALPSGSYLLQLRRGAVVRTQPLLLTREK